MSDVKEINKYYPPDFDPEAFHRHKHLLKQGTGRRRPENARKIGTGGKKMELRMLWPFSIKCDHCQTVLFVGTKFNSKVEKVRGETYLGIAIWRICGICPDCRQEIVLRTDPKNTDYLIERGGHRLFDAALARKEEEEARKREQLATEGLNQMEKLEIKALNTAQEVEDLEALETLKRINTLLLTDNINDDLLSLIKDEDYESEEQAIKEFRRLKELELLKEDSSSSSESVPGAARSLRPTSHLCEREQDIQPTALQSVCAAYSDSDEN